MSTPGHLVPNEITVGAIHTNTEQTLIQITEDRLRLALLDHLARIESRKQWQFPLGVLLAVVPMLLTSDFKDTGFVDKATWKAFFMFAAVGSLIWLGGSLRAAFGKDTVDSLVEKIKNVAKPEG